MMITMMKMMLLMMVVVVVVGDVTIVDANVYCAGLGCFCGPADDHYVMLMWLY